MTYKNIKIFTKSRKKYSVSIQWTFVRLGSPQRKFQTLYLLLVTNQVLFDKRRGVYSGRTDKGRYEYPVPKKVRQTTFGYDRVGTRSLVVTMKNKKDYQRSKYTRLVRNRLVRLS